MRKAYLFVSTLLLIAPLQSEERQVGKIPPGFTSIFNGANLSGWHVSMTNHHGNTREWRVRDGELTGRQSPAGNGGILLTDKRYRDFEVYLEVSPTSAATADCFCARTPRAKLTKSCSTTWREATSEASSANDSKGSRRLSPKDGRTSGKQTIGMPSGHGWWATRRTSRCGSTARRSPISRTPPITPPETPKTA